MRLVLLVLRLKPVEGLAPSCLFSSIAFSEGELKADVDENASSLPFGPMVDQESPLNRLLCLEADASNAALLEE